MKAILLKISGDVQGVSYRYFAKSEAKKLGLLGWAKNEHDGTVSIFLQGPSEKLDEFLAWAEKGSPMARVDDVVISESEVVSDLEGFGVK